MDKETLSNYGWIVICVMVLAVMLAFATPFGNFVADAIKSTTQGLFDVNQGALDSANIHIMQQEFENMLSDKDPELNPTNAPIIGVTYEQGDYIYSRNIISGNEFGAQTLDEAWKIINTQLSAEGMTWQDLVDMYAEYGYTEGQLKAEMGLTEETFEPAILGEGWNARAIDKTKSEYGPILESINGEPITSLAYTFQDCTSMVVAPKVPNSITNMEGTYSWCSSLEEAPILPSGVTNVNHTFAYCTNLKTYTGSNDADGDFSGYRLPNTIHSLDSTFSGNKQMTIAPVIPSSVETLSLTFNGCTSLTDITIPNSVIGMYATFQDCPSITTITIPNSITELDTYLFNRCSSLETVVIPNSVKVIEDRAFWECTSLNTIEIPDSVTTIEEYAFYGCTNLASVKFENTSGWYVTRTEGATSGNAVDVSVPETNATNLKSTYRIWFWYRATE